MTKNIIELLKSFDNQELKRFGNFLRSPYFNSADKLIDLFDIITLYHPEYDNSKLNGQKLFKKLYPGKEYAEKTIKNLYTKLLKQIENFLAIEGVMKDDTVLGMKLSIELSKKKAYHLSDKILNERQNDLKFTEAGIDYYLKQYEFENQKMHNIYKRHEKINDQLIFNSAQFCLENLAGFFFSNFPSLGGIVQTAPQVLNIKNPNQNLIDLIKSFDIKKLFDYLDSSAIKCPEVIKLHYLFFYYQTNDFTENEFDTLKKMLIENADKCSKKDVLLFWDVITFVTFAKITHLNKDVYTGILEISKFLSGLKIFPDESLDLFPVQLFRNIIKSGLYVGDYKWTEEFILEYSNFLGGERQENELNFNLGMLYFNCGKYEESVSFLSKLNLTDIYENIAIRFHLVANYIELKYFDAASSMLKTIRQFYKTNEDVPHQIKPMVKDSLRFMTEIVSCMKDSKPLNDPLYEKATGKDRCVMKKYIVEKMENLHHVKYRKQ